MREIVAIAVAVTLTALLGPEGSYGEAAFLDAASGSTAYTTAFVEQTAFAVAVGGAAGGAINTGTLRGALVGAVTAEAFWGAGNVIASSSGLGIPNNANFSSLTSGQVIGAVGLHAAVGCVSSVASGGRCGSGALSAGLGELTTGLRRVPTRSSRVPSPRWPAGPEQP